MKSIKIKFLLAVCMVAISGIFSNASAQERKLPDGTIIYSDGTKRLPNGTIIYKDGTKVENRNTNVILPDGTVIYPERSRRIPRRVDNDNRRNLPPGQAKKVYGGRAKDYAPGQQKKLKKHDDNDDRYNDRNNDRNDDRNYSKRKKAKKNKD